MAKENNPLSIETQFEYLRLIEKLSSAPVLNGGFERLQQSISDIKETQVDLQSNIAKINSELEHSSENFKRVEEKLDRIYDPENGLYARIAETENLINKNEKQIEDISKNIGTFINRADETTKKIRELEKIAEDITGKIKLLNDVGGENYEEIKSTIKIKKNFSKAMWFVITGFIGTIAKIVWDILAS